MYNQTHKLTLVKKSIIKILEYQNMKIYLRKVTLQVGQKIFVIKKVKIMYRGHVLLMILIEKKLLERFTKMNCKRQIKKNLKLKKLSSEKTINSMLNGKTMIVHLKIG